MRLPWFILAIFGTIEVVQKTIKTIKMILGSITQHLPIFEWSFFNSLMQIITVFILYKVYKKYIYLKDDIERNKNEFDLKATTLAIINHIRGKRLFIKSFDGIQFYYLPDWTEQQKWDNSVNGGMFEKYLFEEFKNVKEAMISEMKNKSNGDIDNILKEYYPSRFFNIS